MGGTNLKKRIERFMVFVSHHVMPRPRISKRELKGDLGDDPTGADDMLRNLKKRIERCKVMQSRAHDPLCSESQKEN